MSYTGAVPPVEHRFEKGQSGNPGGRPVGTRERLTKKFLFELAEDFEAHGKEAIVTCREKKPEAYIKAIAALCPKEIEVKRPLQEMDDAELLMAVRALQSFLAAQGDRAGVEDAGEPTGAAAVSTVQ